MMEESCHSSADNSSINGNTNGNDSINSSSSSIQNTLRSLNKSSHKISKPITKPQLHHLNTSSNTNIPDQNSHQNPPPPPPPAPASQQQQQSQPPVYNINKNDFRDVVQKLTGSPVHQQQQQQQQQQQRLSSPSVIPPAKPTPTSRLHRIRPPPLADLGPRPPPPSLAQVGAASDMGTSAVSAVGGGGSGWMRSSPFSPLPPFPTVSAAAESPITAYMRCLQSGAGINGGGGAAPLQQALIPSLGSSSVPVLPLPTSPLAFGCVPSPRSAGYPLMQSPGLLFPSSPRLPMPSPRWRDL